LSSPGRLHDLFIHCEAGTPGEYKSKGTGLEIVYGFSYSPFGTCMIANTQRGFCALKFVRDNTKEELCLWLQHQWPKAVLRLDNSAIHKVSQSVFPFKNQLTRAPLHLYIKGTNFQIKVWEAAKRNPIRGKI